MSGQPLPLDPARAWMVLDLAAATPAAWAAAAAALQESAGRPVRLAVAADGAGELPPASLIAAGGLAEIAIRPEASDAGCATAQQIARAGRAAGRQAVIEFVIPDLPDTVAALLRKEGPLAQILRLTRELAAAGTPVAWIIPLTPSRVYRLELLYALGLGAGAKPVLLPPDPDAALSGDDRLFAWDFVTYAMLGQHAATLSPRERAAYALLQARLAPDPPPAAPKRWTLIGADGATREVARENGEIALDLMLQHPATATAGSVADRARAMTADLLDVAQHGIPAHLRRLVTPAARPQAGDAPIPTAMLIGAYGGEHIGDAAILGGVLLRIHARHGTTRAILMTQRPYHTRHLIPMLDVPVSVEVREYSGPEIARTLAETDGLVFAGGPLTDLPKQLVRHLDTASRAKRMGKPFVMEGIGPSVFVRKPSQVTARALVQLADRISIRTKDDAGRPIIAGLPIEIGRDPAFDYLATRAPTLSRLPAQDAAQIDTLLAGAGDGPLIGVNIRPIGSLFTVSPAGEDPAAYTRRVEDRCERELAAGLAAFARSSKRKPCFVFFPMNAIQFGMSDLTSAWRILQHMPADVDFRIWEADASLDGVVALIRRLDAVIAMRFHAAIFALSQSCPVIGIDYRIGKRDKVAAVLADAGKEDFVKRVDEIGADWISDRLAAICPAQ